MEKGETGLRRIVAEHLEITEKLLRHIVASPGVKQRQALKDLLDSTVRLRQRIQSALDQE